MDTATQKSTIIEPEELPCLFFLLSSCLNRQPTEAMKFHRPQFSSACSTAQNICPQMFNGLAFLQWNSLMAIKSRNRKSLLEKVQQERKTMFWSFTRGRSRLLRDRIYFKWNTLIMQRQKLKAGLHKNINWASIIKWHEH